MPALKDELIGLERTYWDGIKRKDGETAARLTGNNCIVVGQDGVSTRNQRQMADMMKSAAFELEDYTIDAGSVQFLSLSDDVAVVAYQVRERMKRQGRPETLNAFDTSVWVRKNGQWQCAVHTETPATPIAEAAGRR